MAGESMTARITVVGGVAEWQSGRGSLARRVSQGQGDSRFYFPSGKRKRVGVGVEKSSSR